MRLVIPALLMLSFPVSSCADGAMSGTSCILGPCQPKVECPEHDFVVSGVPSLNPQSSTATVKVGDTISVYFVRRRYWAPCEEPADTIAAGSWSITGPWGQSGD